MMYTSFKVKEGKNMKIELLVNYHEIKIYSSHSYFKFLSGKHNSRVDTTWLKKETKNSLCLTDWYPKPSIAQSCQNVYLKISIFPFTFELKKALQPCNRKILYRKNKIISMKSLLCLILWSWTQKKEKLCIIFSLSDAVIHGSCQLQPIFSCI